MIEEPPAGQNERIDAVMDYHRRAGVKLKDLKLHAITHVVVENQVALGAATPVPATQDLASLG